MRENLLLDLMEFKDWDLTKQFAVARSKVEQISSNFNASDKIFPAMLALIILPSVSDSTSKRK